RILHLPLLPPPRPRSRLRPHRRPRRRRRHRRPKRPPPLPLPPPRQNLHRLDRPLTRARGVAVGIPSRPHLPGHQRHHHPPRRPPPPTNQRGLTAGGTAPGGYRHAPRPVF